MATFSSVIASCRDLARSRDFYRDVLGLTVTTDAFPHWVSVDLGGGRRLGLHPAGPRTPVQPGSMQLGFEVTNVDMFVADAQKLGALVLQQPFDEPFGRLAIISDPDGYPVQIYTPRR